MEVRLVDLNGKAIDDYPEGTVFVWDEPDSFLRPFFKKVMQEDLAEDCKRKGIKVRTYDFEKMEAYMIENNIQINMLGNMDLSEFTK